MWICWRKKHRNTDKLIKKESFSHFADYMKALDRVRLWGYEINTCKKFIWIVKIMRIMKNLYLNQRSPTRVSKDKILLLIQTSLNCMHGVLWSWYYESVEAQHRVRLEVGYDNYFFQSLSGGVKKQGMFNTFLADSTATVTNTNSAPLARLWLFLGVPTERWGRVLVS